jgi:integrator complex subunit 9
MVVTGLNQAVLYDPEQMIQDFCKACIVTVKNQGNVLIPVLPTGKIYDLIECLYRYLSDASLQNIPVYFMSTAANQSLAYSNIYAEWLNDSKQNLVNAAETPFQVIIFINNFYKSILSLIILISSSAGRKLLI